MLNGKLKVYYLPFPVMYRNCIFVNLINLTVPLRTIFIDEKINIVHGHGSFSTMAQECMISANMLNLGMVFTEHSLHGFSDLGSFALNGIWKLTCGPCDNVLAVSNCQLLNVKHRLSSPDDNTLKFQTLPNSIYPELYKPPEFEHPDAKNTIIVVSRLTGRKGALLMVKTLEQVLNIYPEINVIIAGDGPCMVDVEELRENNHWLDRIQLLGGVHPSEVRKVLGLGRIFLNCSLSEAFCMAILEAACAGLHVVTTNVGGIPEVLPDDDQICTLCEPNVNSMVEALMEAVDGVMTVSDEDFNKRRNKQHKIVKSLYTWEKIAVKIEKIYSEILEKKKAQGLMIGERLDRYLKRNYDSPTNCDYQATGVLFVLSVCFSLVIWFCLDFFDDRRSIKRVSGEKANNVNEKKKSRTLKTTTVRSKLFNLT